jgi:predicted AlkP superfamily pyrophosphatase or phosphodiesterase
MAAAVALACAGPEASAPPDSASGAPRTAGRVAFPEQVVFVSVAGLTPSDYREDGLRPPAMPTLAELARSGAAADAVTAVAPAARYPANATLVTGQLPAEHGIVADRLTGDRGVRAARYWHASYLKAPTLWGIAAREKRRVAALGWPTTVGAAIDQLLPDLVPTLRGETWLGVLADASTPAVLELARAAGGADPAADREGAARDAVLATVACELLSSPEPPALLLLHLSQVVPEQALHGPGTPAVRAALRRVDGEIDRVLGCLARSGRLGSTAVVVAGDRGVLPVHTLIAPNAVLAAEELLVPVSPSTSAVARWSALVRSNGGSAFVYARSDGDALRARRALSAEARRTRAFRIVSAEEMLEQGADPEAWFGLEAEPGFAFGNSPTPPLLQPEARRGVGGYFPQHPEMNAGFVAWGCGVRPGVRIPSMRQTDVAPTVARLLGLDLGPVAGRVLVGTLALPETSPPPPDAEERDER